MHVHGAFLYEHAMAPDQVEKLRTAEHSPRPFHQNGKEPALLRTQRDKMSTTGDLHRRLVEPQLMKFQDFISKCRVRAA